MIQKVELGQASPPPCFMSSLLKKGRAEVLVEDGISLDF